jgi:hypothetical protein
MDEVIVKDTITIETDGRLGVMSTQSAIIDAMLCDNDYELIFDEHGNILTE